jgi:uncharacterized protein (TIGR02594 family)
LPNYRITATSLWLRSGPGANFPAVGALYRNNIVQGDEIRGEWLHVATGEGKTGWCNRGYVELVETAPPPPPAGINYRVTVASLNVRAGGGLGYPVIGYLKNGEIVEGLGRSSDGQWAQIRKPDGVVGWASMKYLSKIVIPPLDSAEVYMIVATDRLNIRSGPGETFTVLAQSNRGDFLQFLSSTPDWKWVKVKTQANQIGWCSSKYVTERADGVARNEDFPVKGFHRALSDSIPLRTGPAADAPPVTDLKFNRVVYVDNISPDGKWKHCNNAYGEKGWYPVERLAALGGVAMPKPDEEFAWLPIAFEEFGTREIPGVRNNPRIVEYHKSTDLAQKYSNLPDEVDWCASFVNWCVEKANAPSANSALVHPWTKWGVAAPAPRRGCVITFLWEDGFAHVAFYLGEVGNYVICLGGNQSDAVWTSVYHKKYITSYRVR